MKHKKLIYPPGHCPPYAYDAASISNLKFTSRVDGAIDMSFSAMGDFYETVSTRNAESIARTLNTFTS